MNEIGEETAVGMKPLLSVCIPTYNRCEMTIAGVKEILSRPGDDIEVVIQDNCSTDGTVERLRQLQDSRLRVFRNDKPLIATDNWIECLKNARGTFAYHLNDRDHFRVTYADPFLQTLKAYPGLAAGYCMFSPKRNVTVLTGTNAAAALPYGGYHPSGLVLNMDKVREHLILSDYQGGLVQGEPATMPHLNLLCDLIAYGDYLKFNSPMSENALPDTVGNMASGVQTVNNTAQASMWFEPIVIYTQYIDALKRVLAHGGLTPADKKRIASASLLTVLIKCTFIYCISLLSDEHRSHYGLGRYRIPPLMMEKTALHYTRLLLRDLQTIDSGTVSISCGWVFINIFSRIFKYRLLHEKDIIINNWRYRKEQDGVTR